MVLNFKIMKNLFFAFLLTFSFINADSPEKINDASDKPSCECALDDTADSWCRDLANRAVYNLLTANPNTSFEDAWNFEVNAYATCMAVESVFQAGNVW